MKIITYVLSKRLSLVYKRCCTDVIFWGRWLENNGLRELPSGIFDNNPELDTM